MLRILVEGFNHYVVVYGLNCQKLKNSVMIHCSAQWKIMEDCLRDICNINVGYEGVKGYWRAKFNTPDAAYITEFKTMNK